MKPFEGEQEITEQEEEEIAESDQQQQQQQQQQQEQQEEHEHDQGQQLDVSDGDAAEEENGDGAHGETNEERSSSPGYIVLQGKWCNKVNSDIVSCKKQILNYVSIRYFYFETVYTFL